MVRRVSVLVVAALLVATILPATVAAAGQGKGLHGGSPTAPVTVQCGYYYSDGWWFDLVAIIDPFVVEQMLGSGNPYADAFEKSSAKASAPAFFIGPLNVDSLGYFNNFAYGTLPGVFDPPFTYVQVMVGYYNWDSVLGRDVYVPLASGTTKCQRGLLFVE